VLICPQCGEENPERARFCLSCAAPLEAEEPAERESLKTVSVVFCDMTGSTALGEALDAESLRRVMERYYSVMRTALENHGGTVEKFIGDAVMAVFGVPMVHEDDAVRAVRAAAEMRAGLDTLNEELEERWGVRIGTRTGVNTGEVVAGDPDQEESFISGDAVNVAARLEQTAGAGEILLGADTYRLVRHAVEAEAVDPLTLKGKSEKVPAYRLVRLLDAGPAARRLETSLIGREEELDRLERALEQAIADLRPTLITIVGGAGVGKSRLGHEFVRQVGESARVLYGHCVAYGEGITFWPVAEVLRLSAEITETDGPAEVREKLAGVLAGSEDATAIADRLAALLGVGAASPHQEETFWAVARYLESLAADRPLVVIFEDIHWGEPSFLDLLEYLEHRETDAAILIAAFARPELGELRRHLVRGGSAIHLEPLDREASARLIESRVGGELPAGVAERITEAAEGNPLFVEEMLQMLIDDGYLQREDGGWTLVKELTEDTIPPTIEALLGARIDRLRDRERDIAQRASVAGKVFPRGALTELSPERIRPDLGVYLDSLLQKDFLDLDDSSEWEDESYRFHHVLIRDAAYRSMLKERRAELHERFADWLSSSARAVETEHEELVGYHLEQAYRLLERLGPLDERGRELARRAGAALASSGRRAFNRGDMPAAAHLLERALAVLSAEDRNRATLGIELSAALLEMGDSERARKALEEATERASGDEAVEMQAAVQGGHIRLFSDPELDPQDLVTVAERAIAVFEEAGDDLGLARAWRLWSSGPWRGGRLGDTTTGLARALDHARASGNEREEAETFQWLVFAHYQSATSADEGVEMCEAFAEERRERDRSGYAALLHIQGGFEVMRGNVERGRELYAEGRRLYEELGHRRKLADGAIIAADSEMNIGDAERAEALLRPSLDTLLEFGDRVFACETAALLAGALFAQGKIEKAARVAKVSEEVAIATDIIQQSAWRIVRALVLVTEGKAAEAEDVARQAMALVADTDMPNSRAEAAMALAGVLMAGGKGEDAAPFVEDAIAAYEEKGNVIGVKRARELLTAVAA
jgi:class 3 adenylate cyclase/tetratricopeptide (TPR) repeat protein